MKFATATSISKYRIQLLFSRSYKWCNYNNSIENIEFESELDQDNFLIAFLVLERLNTRYSGYELSYKLLDKKLDDKFIKFISDFRDDDENKKYLEQIRKYIKAYLMNYCFYETITHVIYRDDKRFHNPSINEGREFLLYGLLYNFLNDVCTNYYSEV